MGGPCEAEKTLIHAKLAFSGHTPLNGGMSSAIYPIIPTDAFAGVALSGNGPYYWAV